MKKLTVYIFIASLFWSCHKKPSKILDRNTYKQILKEMILANLIEQKINRNDSIMKEIKLLVYNKYNIDSTLLKKTTDYYSRYPDKLHKIYSEIYAEFKQKSDSLEKIIPQIKPKSDQIKIDKKKLHLKNINKKTPLPD